ncbi:uncharacterized protein RAG0_00323 [Rhynchosporium agropyri]|uniref:AA9 family lytic polysaccharide monooxygenase n=1 Tax=Rhynchosporium agropyri TaxID=914238 RepID=A0A1E1JSC1_9HELO|nr:uncharacterized protein RAG0_00323 [Rhynchosporium agropyri]
MHFSRLSLGLGFVVLRPVAGHSVFTTLFVNDIDQGDGTCVRMPMDPHNATNPINELHSYGGTQGVARVCTVPRSSKLSFQFRQYPDKSQPGTIDSSHLGPCSIYMKHVSSAITSPAIGDGWFKVSRSGYDSVTKKWCTEKLNANNGLMSFSIPEDLAGGYYLVRPELLSLQDADKTPPNPQFYAGCAQVFLSSNATMVPSETVSIPGYVGIGDASVLFDVYNPVWPYKEPGPGIYRPGESALIEVEPVEKQTEGLLPGDAYLTNANWWGMEVSSYGDEGGCWNASRNCYSQVDTCYKTAPPTGSKNCKVWEGRCSSIQTACDKGVFTGPPGYILPLDNSSISNTPGVATTQLKKVDPTPVMIPHVSKSTSISTTSNRLDSSRNHTKQTAASDVESKVSGGMDFGSATTLTNAISTSSNGLVSLHRQSSTTSRESAPNSFVQTSFMDTETLPRHPVSTFSTPVSTLTTPTLHLRPDSSPILSVPRSTGSKSARTSSSESASIIGSGLTATQSAVPSFGMRQSTAYLSMVAAVITSTDSTVISDIVATITVTPGLSTSGPNQIESGSSSSFLPNSISSLKIASAEPSATLYSAGFFARPVGESITASLSTSSSLVITATAVMTSTSVSILDSSADAILSIEIIPSRRTTTSFSPSATMVPVSSSASADVGIGAKPKSQRMTTESKSGTRRLERLRRLQQSRGASSRIVRDN